jgi:hypothetical protein
MPDRTAQLMTNARRRLSKRYLAALRTHLGRKGPGNGDRAQELGRAVLAGGLVTLDLAIMHEKAVVALAASHDFDNMRNGSMKRAGFFFTQALIPLEAAQRATRETMAHLHQRWPRATAGWDAKSRGARPARCSSEKAGNTPKNSCWSRR